MKKFIVSFLLISIMIGGISFGDDAPVEIPVHEETSKNSCNTAETKNVYYYLDITFRHDVCLLIADFIFHPAERGTSAGWKA